MEIEIKHNRNGSCDFGCSFYCSDDCGCGCNLNAGIEGPEGFVMFSMVPGPDCPGPGTYELRKVMVRKVVDCDETKA